MIKIIVKIHNPEPKKVILAVCDSNLIGKRFEENKLQLDLTSNFYKGEEKSKEEILELFKTAYIINLVGKESVELGIQAGVISKENIIKIKGIPHAQCVVVRE